VGAKMTIDSDRLFNGSPERYNWKNLGKKEIYIPANAYKIHANTVKYADLLKPGHANPDYMRYELRRVWVLEATLKEGYRHLYGKRVLFLDEDTGHAVMSDFYDARGNLWQQGLINYYYAFDSNAWHAGTAFYHDLIGGGYVAYNLFQERPKGPVLNKGDMNPPCSPLKPRATPAPERLVPHEPPAHAACGARRRKPGRDGKATGPGHHHNNTISITCQS
jgi:hypothetical protein